ncbi:MAG: transposase [Nocardiopsaceae bacterium]|nr:transposase [Nocardiopsaceae bacterium]
MPRKRSAGSPQVVHRTARCGLRVTRAQRDRVFGLLRSAGDVWSCVLELNRHRRQRGDRPLVGYQELCSELVAAGPGTFGELGTAGARSVLRRYSDSWLSAAKRRAAGEADVRFPRRKRGLVPVRWYCGTFVLEGRRLRIPVARGRPPLEVRPDRDVPYPPDQIRSVTVGYADGRLYADFTAEVPVAVYPEGEGPDPARVAGVDPGVIHPYAVTGPDGQGLLVSGRAIRAENRQHLRDQKGRCRAGARRAPKPGQRGSRRWGKHHRRQRKAEARHQRRVRQARHEAAGHVVDWAVRQRVGTLVIGDPRGVLDRDAGSVHNKRTRDWAPGQLIGILADKAEAAGIRVEVVPERGTSSTCPNPGCLRRVPKPAGRNFTCPHCGLAGHRDMIGAANIAARDPGGGEPPPLPSGRGITHRRAGRHLPGVRPERRDPRRRPSPRRPRRRGHLAGTGPPCPPPPGAQGVARGNARRSESVEDDPRRIYERVHLGEDVGHGGREGDVDDEPGRPSRRIVHRDDATTVMNGVIKTLRASAVEAVLALALPARAGRGVGPPEEHGVPADPAPAARVGVPIVAVHDLGLNRHALDAKPAQPLALHPHPGVVVDHQGGYGPRDQAEWDGGGGQVTDRDAAPEKQRGHDH